VAVRQLNYCSQCGMPLFGRGRGPDYYCRNCGVRLQAPAAGTEAGAVRPTPRLVTDLPHHAGPLTRLAAWVERRLAS
jgi:hypothetical protein